ncbi:MAG: hypothetical protein WBX18_04750, partial [Terracidiphilus sp.]
KGHIPEGPELALIVASKVLPLEHPSRQSRNQIPQGVKHLSLAEFLVHMLHTERDIGHGYSDPLNLFFPFSAPL